MARTMRNTIPIFCFFAVSLLAGCGGGNGSQSPTITAVNVTCKPASVHTGETASCSSTVTGTGNYSSAVAFSATNGTISSEGTFKASTAGTATITATSTQDSSNQALLL